MQKTGLIGMYILMVLMVLFQFPSQAQSKKYFVITGRIVPEVQGTETGTIEITKNGKEVSKIEIPKNNRFRFELEFFNEYSLNFKYPGHFNKIVIVSTEIPQDVWQRDNDFPPFPMVVQLLKEFEGIDKSFTQKPSGKIFYGKDIDNFEKESYISDIQFIEQIETAKSKASQVQKEAQAISKENAQDLATKQKDFDQLIKEADALYQRGEYQMALMKYLEARKLFPEKAYPNDRVAELQDLVKALEMTEKQKAELDQKYKAAIARANGLFDQKNYKDARPEYEVALQYKPGDVFANGRINEIDQLLASLEKQKQYKELIAQADNNFKSKKFDQATNLYRQASQLFPDDQYPKNQLNQIVLEQQQQTKLEQIENDFNQAIQNGTNFAQQKDYLQALNSYKKALELKPDNKLAKDKIAETEQTLVAVETDKKFREAVQLADRALASKNLQEAKLNYQEALKIKPGEAYPKTKLAEIAETESQEIKFNNLADNAEKAFQASNLEESLTLFTQALEIKPQNAAVQKRINDIQNLKKQQAADKEYADLIALADKSFGANQLNDAVSVYNRALQLRKNETYPKDQLRKIENYQTLIKKADKLLDSKDITNSTSAYNEALAVKPNDTYASQKIAEIHKLLEDKKKQEEQAKAELLAYNAAISNADQLFNTRKYQEALAKYKEAATLKDAETYPKKKIKEIEALQSELARKDQEYQSIISQADKSLEQKDYSSAQNSYRKALSLKPEDSYANAQIRKIDEMLAENRRREEETQKQTEAKRELEFSQAMASAEKAFNENDFDKAKTGYETALSLKPNDRTAKEKFGQTEAKLAQQARMTQAYNTAINAANRLLKDKNLKEAKEKYQEALQYLPNMEYPMKQIAQIDEVLAKDEAEAKLQKDFNQAVADGETLLKNKELGKAKEAFQKAYNLIPSESLPPKRLKEIDALLEEQVRNELAQKTTLEAYQNAIQRADKFFGNKEYSSAKLVYNEALVIKADEKYPVDQLALIEKLLKEQNEQLYKTAIAKADNSFNSNQFEPAIASYKEALTYKKDDQYAMQRLKEIDKKKAELEAENLRLKKLQEQYTALIADADIDFKNKVYQKSRDKYQQASGLKPAETYPKEQIAKIDQILGELQKQEDTNKQYVQLMKSAQDAFAQNKLKEARDAYQKAYNLKPFEPIPPSRIAEIDKMLAQLEETAKLAAMEEAQRVAKEKADRDQYEKAVAAGDKSFAEKQYLIARTHYTTALTALPAEKYPKDQIKKIEELLAQQEIDKMVAIQKAQQDSLKKAKDKLFEQAMAVAKDHEMNKRYQQAIQKYQEAMQINPAQNGPIRKIIKDIEDKIQLLAKQETEYKRIIKQADDLYASSKMSEALAEYRNAVTIKPDEDYPKKQISEIQKLLTARDENYSAAIKNGDQAFKESDWQTAKTAYTEALGIKPGEAYPTKRLKEVNQKIAEANLANANKENEDKAYNEAVEKGEKALKEDQLATARMHFEVAKVLKPNEKLPSEKLKEIEALLAQRDKDRLAQTQRELDEKYRQAISVADNSFREKSYAIAKLQYKQALLIKPDESYPQNQMTLIDKLLNEPQPVETYTSQLPKPEVAKQTNVAFPSMEESAQATQTRAESFKPIADYDEAIKKADSSFGVKDYAVARFFYSKAGEIKPDEAYPKNQLQLISKLIDSQLSDKDISEYDNAISQADAAFAKQSYTVAKFFYYKALEIKSWEKYPKDRIQEILALTHSLLSEKEEKEYQEIIAKADEAYFNKDIAIARFYYNKAISIKKDEDYPRIKLKDIQKLIEQDKQDQANLQYRNLIDQGDEAMKLENYSIARFNYNKALTIKPEEKYPKDQLKLIKEALDKPKN